MASKKAVCEDIIRQLEETNQIYIVGQDVPISVSKDVYRMLDAARRRQAQKLGVPEEQYEFEDFFYDMLRGRKHEL